MMTSLILQSVKLQKVCNKKLAIKGNLQSKIYLEYVMDHNLWSTWCGPYDMTHLIWCTKMGVLNQSSKKTKFEKCPHLWQKKLTATHHFLFNHWPVFDFSHQDLIFYSKFLIQQHRANKIWYWNTFRLFAEAWKE